MATAAQVERFRESYDEIERLIRRDMRRIWPQLRRSDPATIRNVLLDLTPRLADQYGAVAMSMAAEWFEAVTGQRATLAELTIPEAVQKSTRAQAGGLWTGRGEAALESIVASTVRHSLQPGRSTVARSAVRNRMRYARSPHPGACAWCLMLASRGAVYRSIETAAGANSYHDVCRCVPEAARDDSELSYDSGALYEKYKAAWQYGDNDHMVAGKMRELYGLP